MKPYTPTADEFRDYCDLLEERIEQSTKQQLAKCAEALALKLAQYTLCYGDDEDDTSQYSQEELAQWLVEGGYQMGETLAAIRCRSQSNAGHKEFLKNIH